VVKGRQRFPSGRGSWDLPGNRKCPTAPWMSDGSPALPRPLDQNHGSPSLSAFPGPHPLFDWSVDPISILDGLRGQPQNVINLAAL
jgi:hypothetical protein